MTRRGGHASGAGSPVSFRCPVERRQRHWDDQRHEVRRTGRTRPYRPSRALGTRSLFMAHEYTCSTCGHRGWTNHQDIVRAPVE